MHLPRQRIPAGLGGYASSADSGDPREAYVLKNLDPPDHKGIMKPRQGLVTQKTYANNVDHLSTHPKTGYFLLTQGGALTYVDPALVAVDVVLDTGWPSGNGTAVKHTYGGNASGAWWIAPKVTIAGSAATVYRVNQAGVFAAVGGGCPSATWVEAYGGLTFAMSELSMQWSADGDSGNWPAANAAAPPRGFGEFWGMHTIGRHEAILMGRYGFGQLTGNNARSMARAELSKLRSVYPAHSGAVCDKEFLTLAPGPSLRAYRSGFQRIDYPVMEDLLAITDAAACHAWYDPQINCYCLSELVLGKTFLFSLDLRRWIGYWDKGLRGLATSVLATPPFMKRWYANGPRLAAATQGSYADNGTTFQVEVQTIPSNLGMAEEQKQLNGVLLDGGGTAWNFVLDYRATPADAWSTEVLGTQDAGKWMRDIPPIVYGQRKIRAYRDAGSTVQFRELIVDEQDAGEVL